MTSINYYCDKCKRKLADELPIKTVVSSYRYEGLSKRETLDNFSFELCGKCYMELVEILNMTLESEVTEND